MRSEFNQKQNLIAQSLIQLNALNIDNRFVYSGIKAVKGLDNNTTVDVSIMPNPNHGQFKILINGVSQSHQAFITDLSGKVVKQLTVQPQ